jgi:hypothetical protein
MRGTSENGASEKGSGAVRFGERVEPGSLAWVSAVPTPAAEDRLVTTAFHFVVDPAGLAPAKARELGRTIGSQARPDELADYLDAFSHLGIGTLRFHALESDRYAFSGDSLRGSERANAASCALALGFLEGAVSSVSGHAALGAEMRCRSRGDACCEFTVRARAPR